MSLSYDAFSYGMVMYELFSYQLPFAEVSSLLVPNKILEGNVRNSNEYFNGLCKYKCTNMMLCLISCYLNRDQIFQILVSPI